MTTSLKNSFFQKKKVFILELFLNSTYGVFDIV